MTSTTQRTADRDMILGTLVSGDDQAHTAYKCGEDLILIQRIVKVGMLDALNFALERRMRSLTNCSLGPNQRQPPDSSIS